MPCLVVLRRVVAQGALAQAVQEHREWVKFRDMTQEFEHGPVLAQKEGLLSYSHYLSTLVPTLDSRTGICFAGARIGVGAQWGRQSDLADLAS